MRKFRSDGKNLADRRIVYIFLASATVVCTVMALLIGRYERITVKSNSENRQKILTECADALVAWERAENAEGRLLAAVRFESSVVRLPSEVEIEPLLELSHSMLAGDADAESVRAVADTFSLLSDVSYGDEKTAWQNIGDVLAGVFGVTAPRVEEDTAVMPAEVLAYTEKVVKKSVRRIFDGNEGNMSPTLSENGKKWTVSADNVLMDFDAQTGSLDRFVFLRLGAVPDKAVTDTELIDIAVDFYCTNRRCRRDISAVLNMETNGFSAVDITDKDEHWRLCLDGHGRVWSLTKVKR